MKINPHKKEAQPHQIFGFDSALIAPNKWISPAFFLLDEGGKILSIETQLKGSQKKLLSPIKGIAIPSFINAHSHAFQWAIAGLTESKIGKKTSSEDFWAWRKQMYGLCQKLNPESYFQIAKKCFESMLKRGITHVVEFHYVHHDLKGQMYSDPCIMGLSLLEAAKVCGIGITLIPVFYERYNFTTKSNSTQKRFSFKNIDSYLDLLSRYQKIIPNYPDAILGSGAHSLRASTPENVKIIFNSQYLSGPKHIHIAEQRDEVSEVLKFLRQTPIRWLLDNCKIDKHTNLIHATHSEQKELTSLAQSGANVVLCPSTEANLGDGFFDLTHYQKSRGFWSIGSDSQLHHNFLEELRWLDYGVRLQREKRLLFHDKSFTSHADYLFHHALKGGEQAAGIHYDRKTLDYFKLGFEFSAVNIQPESYDFNNVENSQKLSLILYTQDSSAIKTVIRSGRLVFQNLN